MTRKKFRFFMVTFIIFSVFVVMGFMVQNLNKNNQNSAVNSLSDKVTNESNVNSEDLANTKNDTLEFYVNDSSVKKTKTTSNEVTTFVIETKLFITNNGPKTASIDPDAFKINYDMEGLGLLYSIEYGQIEKPIILDKSETTSINFIVKYVIQDIEKFNDNKKRELKFNYIDKEILVCLV